MRNDDERGLPGTGMAPRRQSAVNYNDRVLDFVRAALGIPRTFAFGLDVPNAIWPVVVVDPDSPPLLQSKGWLAGNVALSVANFSAVAIQNVGGAGGILKVRVRAVKVAGGGINVRLCQGAVDTYTVTNAWTEAVTPSTDSRLAGPSGTSGSGVAKVASRNTVAAAWAPPASVVLAGAAGLAGVAAGTIIEFGEVWLDQFDAVTIEHDGINRALEFFLNWEYFAPVR